MRKLALCVLLFAATTALAHDSEPINTRFAAPFARGSGNVQLLYQYLRRTPSYEVLPLEFEYGFARRQQFSIGIGLVRLDDGNNIFVRPGNLELEYRLLVAGDNQRKYAVSINPVIELPTGDKRVAERSLAAGGTVNIDTHVFRNVWTHANIGYETPVARIGQEREKNVIYNFAAMYELSDSVRPVVELVGVHDLSSETTNLAMVPELIFSPNHRVEFKLGVPVGLTSTSPDFGVQAQLTWKFGHGRE